MIKNIIKLNKELKEAREEIKRLNDIKKSLELELNNRSIYSKREVYITNALCNLHKVYIARELIPKGNKVAMFMRLLFCEGKERKKLFEEHPPRTIYVFSSRIKCAKNGDFESIKSSAVCYAWFVWVKGYKGETTIKWL